MLATPTISPDAQLNSHAVLMLQARPAASDTAVIIESTIEESYLLELGKISPGPLCVWVEQTITDDGGIEVWADTAVRNKSVKSESTYSTSSATMATDPPSPSTVSNLAQRGSFCVSANSALA
jgi:hypothetical protein